MKKYFTIISLLLLSLTTSVWADEHSNIIASMKAVWDKPDNPLIVKPVIIADDFAIAGWLQGEKGGRALLKKGHHGWQTLLCAGQITPSLLKQAGVPKTSAELLILKQTSAEKGLSQSDRSQLSSFIGVLKMDAAHASGQHHPHTASAASAVHHSH
ncbi:copper uptake system-associated protein [Deefgea rivuli]|uniref:copper uptake system-associated protein n=1 Tax=Deefgea rivuli TaxID=400948 RepID=UPI000688F7D4|nr:copper uptake system-associated protein [Deefgea rivuli]